MRTRMEKNMENEMDTWVPSKGLKGCRAWRTTMENQMKSKIENYMGTAIIQRVCRGFQDCRPLLGSPMIRIQIS